MIPLFGVASSRQLLSRKTEKVAEINHFLCLYMFYLSHFITTFLPFTMYIPFLLGTVTLRPFMS